MWSFLVCVTVILGSGVLSEVSDNENTPFHLRKTSFSCQNRAPGYYADLETGCRTYHVCDGNSHFTYVCPPRTLFQQRSRICDHSYLVRCEDSPSFFDESYPEDEDEILLRLVESEEHAPTENFDDLTTLPVDSLVKDTTQPRKISPTQEIPLTLPPLPPEELPSDLKENVPELKQNADIQKAQAPGLDETLINRSGENKTLRFVVKDFRSLFYIPEVESNAISGQAEREFALPLDKKKVMKFRNEKKARHAFSACPGYCDPKFFLPGTCHPCIMIK